MGTFEGMRRCHVSSGGQLRVKACLLSLIGRKVCESQGALKGNIEVAL